MGKLISTESTKGWHVVQADGKEFGPFKSRKAALEATGSDIMRKIYRTPRAWHILDANMDIGHVYYCEGM